MQKKVLTIILSVVLLSSMVLSACAPEQPAPAAVEEPAVEEPVVEEPAAEVEEPAEPEPTEAPTEEVVEEPEEVTITDFSGRTVTLEKLPERVVVAGKATPYTLSTTYVFPEAIDRVVAYELRGLTLPEYMEIIDPKYNEKTQLEMESGPEQIAPSKPEIVVMKNWAMKSLEPGLTELDIPVVGLNLETPEVMNKDLDMLGQLFGNPDRAEAVKSYLMDKEETVKTALSNLTEEEKPSVLVIQYSDKDGEVAFKVPPASYLQTTMAADAGGIPVWVEGTEEESSWVVVNFEQIAAWDADMVFVINYKGDSQETAQNLMENELWQELTATKNGQIYGFGKDFQSWDLPDPRWILGYTWLATKIQPDLMSDVDMMSEVKEFYSFMYDLDDAVIEETILSRVVAP